MPTYEYQCSACKHEFERDQRIREAPLKKCPKCGKQKAKRLISRTSFVLKGGGWYGDLYGSVKPASESKPEAKDAGASKDSAASAPAGSEAAASKSEGGDAAPKPEAKTEKKPEKKKSGKGQAAA